MVVMVVKMVVKWSRKRWRKKIRKKIKKSVEEVSTTLLVCIQRGCTPTVKIFNHIYSIHCIFMHNYGLLY